MQKPPVTDLQPVHYASGGQNYVDRWHPPDIAPEGTPFGSAAICFTPSGETVIGSANGRSWEFPGGRPEPGENWRATLDREVLEEVCATIDSASHLGFVQTECLSGPKTGVVHVRSLWVAHVTLLPWKPQDEIKIRRLIDPQTAIELVCHTEKVLPVYQRWLTEALAHAQVPNPSR